MTYKSIVTVLPLLVGVASYCCIKGTFELSSSDSDTTNDASKESESDRDSAPDIDAGRPPSSDQETDTAAVSGCGFDYEIAFSDPAAQSLTGDRLRSEDAFAPQSALSYSLGEPSPPYTFAFKSSEETKSDLILPAYEDNMPLFDRASPWTKAARCFELEDGARLLTESEAFDLYRRIAETVTGDEVNDDADVRTVIGLRGAYPGTFAWNGNAPDLFNDTLVLLFVDETGKKNVREFAGSTDVGAHDFGFEQSSFLPAGRSYRYLNGYHGDNPYSALVIDETDYLVMDDTNANGHWDDDRNGRLPPPGDDTYRTGFGHNIHVGSVNAPLGAAHVGVWSAGCQLISGMASWTEFITNAWTGRGDEVRYFLIDARDIEAARLDFAP